MKKIKWLSLILGILLLSIHSVQARTAENLVSSYFIGYYDDSAGGFALYETLPSGWILNRSLGIDLNQDQLLNPDEAMLTALVPAIGYDNGELFFPFYHSIIGEDGQYTVSPSSIDVNGRTFSITQVISNPAIELTITIESADDYSAIITYNIRALQDLSSVVLYSYFSPDFGLYEFEIGTVDTSHGSPYFSIQNDKATLYASLFTPTNVEWELGEWGDGPDMLNTNDVFSKIVLGYPFNNANSASGDLDFSMKFLLGNIGASNSISRKLILSMAKDPANLYTPSTSSTSQTTTSTTPQSSSVTTNTPTPKKSTTSEGGGGFLSFPIYTIYVGIITVIWIQKKVRKK